MKSLIIIPSRMASMRLPGKPLADIQGRPMIAHVLTRAELSGAGPVYVACAEEAVAAAVRAQGGQAVMTPADLSSGTDRVRYAANLIDPDHEFDIVVNVQGDMPSLPPALIADTVAVLTEHVSCDIATAVTEIKAERERTDPNVVKAVLAQTGQALYFTRAEAPTGEGPLWHHIGIYAYRRAALEAFCALPPSPLETRERLEQLRALENGQTIYAVITDHAPAGVDTPEDLQRARQDIELAS